MPSDEELKERYESVKRAFPDAYNIMYKDLVHYIIKVGEDKYELRSCISCFDERKHAYESSMKKRSEDKVSEHKEETVMSESEGGTPEEGYRQTGLKTYLEKIKLGLIAKK